MGFTTVWYLSCIWAWRSYWQCLLGGMCNMTRWLKMSVRYHSPKCLWVTEESVINDYFIWLFSLLVNYQKYRSVAFMWIICKDTLFSCCVLWGICVLWDYRMDTCWGDKDCCARIFHQGGHNYAQYPCHVTRPESACYTDSVGMSYKLMK